jgi:hypothetical protein
MHSPIKIYPLTGLIAKQALFGGAWRLFVAAKSIDGGQGWISKDQLKSFLAGYGVSDRTFRNWLVDAISAGIIKPWIEQPDIFDLVSTAKMAAIFGCKNVDKAPMLIPAKKLFSAGWHSVVWSAYIKSNHQSKNVSQDMLYKLTGINPSTQRIYNKTGKVQRRRNIAVSNIPADHLDGIREHTNRTAPFIFKDPQQAEQGATYKSVVAWHIPSRNTSQAHDIIPASNGRTRNISLQLRTSKLQRLSKFAIIPNFSTTPGQVQTVKRLFCEDAQEYKKTCKQRRRDSDRADIYIVRKFKRANKTFGIYTAC